MNRRLGVLYRGPLDSCNYACAYCPFAKRPVRQAVQRRDQAALARFVEWAERAHAWDLEVLFTPYGEALIWPWYQAALVRLSRARHVRQVSIQTNGAGPMAFLEQADRTRVSLWVSWHPTEITAERFAAKIHALHAAGTRLSVGAVAVPAHLAEVEALRAQLPPAVPMWINAQKPGPRYDEAARARWRAIDPSFDVDAAPHQTHGVRCLTGEDTISVDGEGAIRRCHFVAEVLGNLYTDDLAGLLAPRPCPNRRCDCWIGYANLPHLGLRDGFAPDGRLSRIRAR